MTSSSALPLLVFDSLATLKGVLRRPVRLRAVLLVIMALLNTAQGIACNLYVSQVGNTASAYSTDGVVNFSHDDVTSLADTIYPTDPLDIDGHCLHICYVHSLAFATSAIAHELFPVLNVVPTSGMRLRWPTPPLSATFRPPIAS